MLQTRPQGRAIDPDSPHSLLDVPDNVLQNILQRLDLQQRLSPVCTRWLNVGRRCPIAVAGLDYEKLQSLLRYARKYEDDISSMSLEAREEQDLQKCEELWEPFPGANLRNLELRNFQMERRSGSEFDHGVLSITTGLTRLVIDTALFTPSSYERMLAADEGRDYVQPGAEEEAAAAAKADAAASFANVIQHLTSLQELQLHYITVEVEQQTEDPGWYMVSRTRLDIPGDGLATLTQLTKLWLAAAAANPRGTLLHISRLQRLQDLQLDNLLYPDTKNEPAQLDDLATDATADTFAGIPSLQHLTSLSVFRVPGMLTRQHLQGPGRQLPSSALTGLQRLQLDEVVFQPTLLAGMKQLTCLELSNVIWVLESQHLPPGPGVGQPPPALGQAAYQLLLLLPCLKQLRRLRLDIETWPEAEYQLPAYSALTANTNLEHLDLQQYQYPLPTTAWKHIFRKELQLPGIAAVEVQGIAPETSEGRVLDCCPVAAAGMREGRVSDGLLELRGLDEDEGVSPEELRLLEVNADDPPGVPAVLGALTHLEVVFSGEYHGWGVHGCSEAEF